jgi:ubiquinone/menaquinone biosynthesis C-methylase UbiE
MLNKEKKPMYLARISRLSRSFFTLNRDREYAVLNKMLSLEVTDTLLDIGCGDGFWTTRFAKQCAHVTGIDPGEQTLRYARILHNRPNISYVRGVAESVSFPNSTFDKVVSISCLEHFADPLQGLREMARVLKPGGRAVLSVDSLLPENSPAAFREWHKRRHFVTQYFSQDKLSEMAESVGLRLEPARTVHLFRSRVAAYLRQTFIRRPRLWLPAFPLFYAAVRLADRIFDDTHGQIVIFTATR